MLSTGLHFASESTDPSIRVAVSTPTRLPVTRHDKRDPPPERRRPDLQLKVIGAAAAAAKKWVSSVPWPATAAAAPSTRRPDSQPWLSRAKTTSPG